MEQFVKGETIWKVHVFPTTGKFSLTKYEVVKESKLKNTKSPSLIVYIERYNRNSEISLIDANVIPNTYNCHRIFRTCGEAEDYVNDPDSWRPLEFTEEQWKEFGKADYLARKKQEEEDQAYYDEIYDSAWFGEV